MSNGFEQINQTLWISKDPSAVLPYTFDWSEWLAAGDTISSAEYTVTARVNDPSPLAKVSQGISEGTKTYVELESGQSGKSYVVTVAIETSNGLIDSRFFRVKVEPRSA